jgi:hypothetical protein
MRPAPPSKYVQHKALGLSCPAGEEELALSTLLAHEIAQGVRQNKVGSSH